MSLENLLRIGKLKAHAADEVEIARLLESADRALVDAARATLSKRAWTSPASDPVPVATAGLPPQRIQVLEAYRKARNQSDYHGVPVSDVVAHDCVEDARRLVGEVRASGRPDRGQGSNLV